MTSLDYEQLKAELLVAIRGERSQRYINKKFGFSFNQMYRWESSYKKMGWPDFVKFCQVCKADLPQAFFSAGFPKQRLRLSNIGKLTAMLIAPLSPREASQETQLSVHKLKRWLANESIPSVEDIFCLMDVLHNNLLFVAEGIADLNRLPSTRPLVKEHKLRRKLRRDHPSVFAITRCLDLESYKQLPFHDDEFLATKAGIRRSEIKKILPRLEKAGFIVKRDDHYINRLGRIFVREDFDTRKQIKSYWAERAVSQFERVQSEAMEDQNLFGFAVFTVSDDGWQKMKEIYQRFFEEMANTIDEEKKNPAERSKMVALFLQDIEN